MSVDEMVERGELERVEPDSDAAEAALEEARRHIQSARAIAGADPNGAFQLAYDAARKAVAAHMRRHGYRVRRGEGGHALTARYLAEALDDEHGRRLDAMRRRRNRSEYGSAFFSAAELEESAALAESILAAVSG